MDIANFYIRIVSHSARGFFCIVVNKSFLFLHFFSFFVKFHISHLKFHTVCTSIALLYLTRKYDVFSIALRGKLGIIAKSFFFCEL